MVTNTREQLCFDQLGITHVMLADDMMQAHQLQLQILTLVGQLLARSCPLS
eukprot:COSAG02_NODE_25388_length_660_cov_0.918004_1_plen_50_part_10